MPSKPDQESFNTEITCVYKPHIYAKTHLIENYDPEMNGVLDYRHKNRSVQG